MPLRRAGKLCAVSNKRVLPDPTLGVSKRLRVRAFEVCSIQRCEWHAVNSPYFGVAGLMFVLGVIWGHTVQAFRRPLAIRFPIPNQE